MIDKDSLALKLTKAAYCCWISALNKKLPDIVINGLEEIVITCAQVEWGNETFCTFSRESKNCAVENFYKSYVRVFTNQKDFLIL